jgi:predicted membrane channel-forming protein YqfA (hemolysin III family)
VIQTDDDQYFEKERFLKDIQKGDNLDISILKRVKNSQESYRIAFEIKANGFTYLPSAPLLDKRLRERHVTFPIIIAVSSIIALVTYLAWRHPNPILDLALCAYLGTMIMIAIDALFRKSDIPGVLPTLFLIVIYPILWLFQRLFQKMGKKEWLLNLGCYSLMILLGAFSFFISAR